MQGKVLVRCVALLLAVPLPLPALMGLVSPGSSRSWLEALGVGLTFAVLVWALRAATPMGSFCGGLVTLVVILGTAIFNNSVLRSGLVPLIALFVLTFAATKAGKRRKVQLGVAEAGHGRSAAQVVANLGMAGLVIVAGWFGFFGRFCCGGDFQLVAMPVCVVAALCEATADTVSSEIGQAFGGRPFLLTTLRRVEAGTDGAVSLLGTVAGVAAAAMVAWLGFWAMRMSYRQAGRALVGGVAGLVFDSLLGATAERRGWLGNDLVNFFSTGFAVGVALGVVLVWG
jgi:uncharacterized protein (TIGR00297 family)